MAITSWSGEIIVNQSLVGDQTDPELAVLANGNIVVVWEDAAPAIDEVKYRILDPTGKTITSEAIVTNDIPAGDGRFDPSVAAFSGGRFAVAHEAGDSGFVYYASNVYQADGTPGGSSVTINGTISLQEANLFSFDTFVGAVYSDNMDNDITFQSLNESGGGTAIGASHFNNSALEVETDPRGVQLKNSAGDIIIVWENDTTNEIEFQRFSSNTGTLLGAETVVADPGNAVSHQQVIALENGGFVIGYSTFGGPWPANSFDLAFRIYSPGGTAYGGEVQINSLSIGQQINLQLVALRDGGFMAIWANDSNGRIYAKQFDAFGSALTGDVVISTTAAIFAHDILSADIMADGRVAVTWETEAADGGIDRDIVMKIIDPRDGNAIGTGASETLYGSASDDDIFANSGDDTVYAMSGNDFVYGGDGVDIIMGDSGDDQLFGEGGNDQLVGGEGNDVLNPGSGSGPNFQFLYGQDDNDSYRYSKAADRVYISAAGEFQDGGTDELIFTDISLTAMTIAETGGNIKFQWTEGLDSGEMRVAQNGQHIESFIFADGTTLASVAVDASGRPTLYGTAGSDIINGTLEDDSIVGGAGNDTLNAAGSSGGFQYMYGQSGDDTYFYRKASGNTIISASAEQAGGGTDTLRLTDLDFADVTVTSSGGFLRFSWTDGAQSGQLRVGSCGDHIETYRFADGTIMGPDDFLC